MRRAGELLRGQPGEDTHGGVGHRRLQWAGGVRAGGQGASAAVEGAAEERTSGLTSAPHGAATVAGTAWQGCLRLWSSSGRCTGEQGMGEQRGPSVPGGLSLEVCRWLGSKLPSRHAAVQTACEVRDGASPGQLPLSDG